MVAFEKPVFPHWFSPSPQNTTDDETWNKCAGLLFTYAETQGSAFTFAGFAGKPAGYMIVFCYCAVAYIVGWICMKSLVPHYKRVVL